MKLWWTFKGEQDEVPHNLTTNDGIMISKTTQKISMIAIDAVKARHRGNYTCYAQNRAGVAQQSSYLSINGSSFYQFCFYSSIPHQKSEFCNLFCLIFNKFSVK